MCWHRWEAKLVLDKGKNRVLGRECRNCGQRKIRFGKKSEPGWIIIAIHWRDETRRPPTRVLKLVKK